MGYKKIPPAYNVWAGMKDRCLNKRNRSYYMYGGRGISVCKRWRDSYANFAEDMLPRPEGYSLDRIDNDGDYSPENCRWATRQTQQRNRRGAVYVTIDGVKYRAIELADRYGLKADTIVNRAKKGLSFRDVVDPEKRVDISGLALGGKASGRMRRTITHCPHGHEYTDKNTITSKQGWRRCRKCFYKKEKERRANKGRG